MKDEKKINIYTAKGSIGFRKVSMNANKINLETKNLITVLDQTLSTTVTKIIAELQGLIKTLNLEACNTIIGS